jgi:hypothetical protein
MGANTKMVQDKFGFAVGNFQRTMPLGTDLFAFSTQCCQVFFLDDNKFNAAHGGDWKVICGTEVKGCLTETQPTFRLDIQVLVAGRDENFEGLSIVEPLDAPV